MTVAQVTNLPAAARQRLAGAIRHGLCPTADQVLIAASNFAAIVIVARSLSVAAFGAFTLVYSLLHFANSMQLGLVTQPHNVLGATRRGVDYVRYTTSTAMAQLLLATLFAGLLVISWSVARALDYPVAPLLLAAAPATFAWQVQEFLRRVLYTETRFAAALACDLLAYGGQVGGIVMLWRWGHLSGESVLYIAAGGYAVAGVFGAVRLRRSFGRHFSRHEIRENWHFGKWIAGGSVIGQWLSGQMLVYLAAVLIGAVAAGVLRSVHTLFGPARILVQVFSITLPTRLARTLAQDGDQALRSQWNQTAMSVIPLLGAYCLLTAIFAQPLISFVFGDQYRGYAGVLALYAVSAWLTYLCILLSAALRARRLTRSIFVGEVIYLLVIPIGAVLIPVFGIYGIVIGLIAGDLAVLVYLWRTHQTAGKTARGHNADDAVMSTAQGVIA